MRRFSKIYALVLAAVALSIVIAAAAHKAGINSDGYVHSPLIAVQMFGLLALFITTPASVIMAVVVAFQKKWKEVLCMGGCALVPILTFGVAASINSETVVYTT